MTKPPKAFDVWLMTADTVYKGVPYQVVAGWVGEGRLGPADKVRPAGTAAPWAGVGESPLLADYLPRAAPVADVAVGPIDPDPNRGAEPVEAPDPAEIDAVYRQTREEEDDEVDMIPLIDISMVLLVFFIIVSATGALSPVDVPDMKYGGELTSSPDAITIAIEKAIGEDKVVYSVRTGATAAAPNDSGLPGPDEALAALDRMLMDRTRPPDVRIACDKTLPSDRVMEMTRGLKTRKDKGKINAFEATVNEAPKAEK